MTLLKSTPGTIAAYWQGGKERYDEKLDEVDLEIACLDRKRRTLRRKRARMERDLGQVEAVIEAVQSSDGVAALTAFVAERDGLLGRLDEVNLSIARLGRDRRVLKQERKALETAWNRCGPSAFQ